jgi:serine/threonine-protein kinase
MEFVDGPTLEQYLAAQGPLNEAQVRKVFADAIDGLAKAHAAGIVHRDIKPGNMIFRKSDQRLVFVDFGLAA